MPQIKQLVPALLFFIACLNFNSGYAQPLNKKPVFTYADTLRGSNGPGRDWWDALKYDLHVQFNPLDSSISGYNVISFKALKKGNTMQIDLQEPMVVDSIRYVFFGKWKYEKFNVNFSKDGNTYFFTLPKHKQAGGPEALSKVTVYYHGRPKVARQPPWDGGLVWKKDKELRPWITVACQGLGASVWYPCKDYQGDEPDSAEMHVTTPADLVCVSNGRLRGKKENADGTVTWDWAVTNPINNYNLVPYIGKYVHFNEIYNGENGKLDMDYWVLDYNLEKAKKQFTDATRMMKAFEHWFGPYPFYKDGYKLVDAPHLGMEHQSAIAYGNSYKMGYSGRDLSGTDWGLKWDFIIVHESGHEWFANNITTKDIADMWVHEGFTNYSETLFTDYYYGKEAGNAYVIGTRRNIRNDIPIIGHYGVNQEGSGDMYYKAGNMIHAIRQVINDDEKFRQILRGLNKTFYHQTVTTQQVQDYINKTSKINFDKVFEQYLTTIQVPVLEYRINGYDLSYRYTNCVKGFNMPLKISFKEERWIKPTEEWQTIKLSPEGNNEFKVDPNFYINTKKSE